MTRSDSEPLRRELRELVEHAETALQRLARIGHADESESGTAQCLRHARPRLDAFEHAATRARVAGNHVRDYLRDHRWLILGGFAALMLVAGALSRGRP